MGDIERNDDFQRALGFLARREVLRLAVEVVLDVSGRVGERALVVIVPGPRALDTGKRFLDELPELSVVSRYGIGVNNIDIGAVSDHGVAVTHVPSYCEEEVATHALSLLITLAQKMALYDREFKSGTWVWKVGHLIELLTGKAIGFVAFGKIPRTFATLADGFDFEYLTYDPYTSRRKTLPTIPSRRMTSIRC